MPAYNEEANIEHTVSQWHPVVERLSQGGVISELVIANDGSRDNTYNLLVSLQSKYPLLTVLDKANTGHGATVLHLYRYALDNEADYIFQTDSDGQTNPEEFWPMWEEREQYDFQIGYRAGRQDGWNRVFVTRTLRLVVWSIFHVWVPDANTPFRLMQSGKLSPIMEVVPHDFFLCNVAISAIAVKWGYKINWPNIMFKPRQGGVNSINFKRIIRIGWKTLADFRIINSALKRKETKE